MADTAAETATQQPLVAHRIRSIAGEEKSSAATWWYTIFFGSTDLSYFYRPLNFCTKTPVGKHHLRFRHNYEFTPLFLAILLGFQHAIITLCSAIIPAFVLAAAFPGYFRFYIMQAAVLLSGICTVLSSVEIKLIKLPTQLGTGLLSVLTNSAVFVPVYIGCMKRMIEKDNESIHDAYGKMLGTTAVCSLAYIALTCIPRKYIKQLIPPVVAGLVIVMIGMDRMIEEILSWGGGIFCAQSSADGTLCQMSGDVNLVFGSGEYLGLGLLVLVVYFLIEIVGTPFTRHNNITISIILVYILSAIIKKDGQHYVTDDYFDNTPDFAFLWTTTYKLGFYKGAVMPLLGAFVVMYLESTAIFTSTVEESRIRISDTESDQRIQGGLLVSSITSFLGVLATGLPLGPAPQNNSLITLTGQASNTIGVATGIWLFIFGVFGKILAAFLEIPASIKGSIGTFIFAGVLWSGLKILARAKWDRRTCLIVFYAITFGLARILVPDFIADPLWNRDEDASDFVISFRFMVLTVLRVTYFLGGFVAIILNQLFPQNMEIEEQDSTVEETYEAIVEP